MLWIFLLEVIILYVWKMYALFQSGARFRFVPKFQEAFSLKCTWRFYQH